MAEQAAGPAFTLPEGLTVETLLSQYGTIGDQLDELEAKHKAATAPLAEMRDQITAVVHKYMLAQNLQNQSAAGRVYRFPIRSVRRWLAKNAPVCQGCGNEIDPATCGCGSPVKDHGYADGHGAVPMGCACGYAKGA